MNSSDSSASNSPDSLYKDALHEAKQKNFEQAIVVLEQVTENEKTTEFLQALAHFHYLNGNVDHALTMYQALVSNNELTAKEQEQLKVEIKEIHSRDAHSNESLASTWLRSRIALENAKEAVAAKNFQVALEQYDKAYQYSGNSIYLFESALAASMVENWEWALNKYKEFLAVGKTEIPKELIYRVLAETDRLIELKKGNDVVTYTSLADEIYAERSGDQKSDGAPPFAKHHREEDASDTVSSSQAKTEPEENDNTEKVTLNSSESVTEIKDKPKKRTTDISEKTAETPKGDDGSKIEETQVEKASLSTEYSPTESKQNSKKSNEPLTEENRQKEVEKLQQEREAIRREKAEKKKAVSSNMQSQKHEESLNQQSAQEVMFEDLLFYVKSKSATVRYRAVNELISVPGERARIALEDRVINDRNMHVRHAAVNGLVARRSIASLPVLEHALITAATSQERAVLKSAISTIRLGLK